MHKNGREQSCGALSFVSPLEFGLAASNKQTNDLSFQNKQSIMNGSANSSQQAMAGLMGMYNTA